MASSLSDATGLAPATLSNTLLAIPTDLWPAKPDGGLVDVSDPALAKLCDVCTRIFQGKWVRLPDEALINEPASPQWVKEEDGRIVVQWHHTLAALKISASNGCQLCSMLYEQLSTPHSLYERVPSSSRVAKVPGVVDLFLAHESYEDFHLWVTYDIDGQFDGDGDGSSIIDAAVSIQRVEADQYASLAMPMSTFEPLEHVIRNINDWVSTCVNDHPECRMLQPSPDLPTRLLYVGYTGAPTLRLCESIYIPGRPAYITLSHCWGGKQPFRLVVNNYEHCLKSIEESELPLTFRHAVAFVRQLGIQYLWIDALCIIQDSGNMGDWCKEAGRMADVYTNGYLNIAATASVDCHGGLFRQRDHALIRPCFVRPDWAPSGQHYVINSPEAFSKRVLSSPLHKRAWVFQERILAPRTVYFARDQVWWQCVDSTCCETFPEGMPHSNRKGHPLKDLRESIQLSTEHSREVWRDLVTNYTPAKLTYGSDRLVAVAGVAMKVQKILDWKATDYRAGLWKHCLPGDLLWITNEYCTRITDPYVAPSWSWASVSGGVHIFSILEPENICVDMLEVETEFDRSPFGPLTSGWLTLRAQMHHVILSEPEVDRQGFAEFTKLTLANDVQLRGNSKAGEFFARMDDQGDLAGCAFVSAWWCIIGRRDWTLDNSTHFCGLILRRARQDDGAEVYSRIGFLEVKEQADRQPYFSSGGSLSLGKVGEIVKII